MSIAENIARVRANIAAAAREAGRDPAEITLVGASKMNDAAACREAIAAGIDALGENRVQEMTAKLAEHAYDGAPLHFIGHLQRNKVNKVVGHVDLIQSVGSLELLDEIERVAAARDLVQDILLEVNIGREEAKSGFAKQATGRTIYILDEPTTGLHSEDVRKLLEVLQRLVDTGNTVVVIEHNLDVIKCADHLIDLGPEGGDGGGTVVVTGTPEEVAACPESFTGQYLKKVLVR